MASTSAIVNRALRASVGPVLRSAGFAKVDARNGLRWLDRAVWVFKVRAVGNYFSEVTGWPPGSVVVPLGVFYPFFALDRPVKVDDSGRVLPPEYRCHSRSHLTCRLDQRDRTDQLKNPAERRRTDIWWVDRDGSNAPAVAADVALALEDQGLPWFALHSDVAATLAEVEQSRDCLVKFEAATFLARELGDQTRWRKYAELATAEATRIGRLVDPHARYGT